MKPAQLASSILSISLALSLSAAVFAHVGHGDEFQSSGGVQKVKINPQTDQMLGITVTPIAQAANGGAGVMVPVTSLVDADGKQLVFVQYENFYEPVEVKTGATKGELVEITEGLSMGEKLVTQGGLSLYAESRKTQSADAASSSSSTTAPQAAQTANTHTQADAQGIPHSHDAAGNMAKQPSDAPQESTGFPLGLIAAGVGGVVLLGGASAIALSKSRRQKSISSKNEGF